MKQNASFGAYCSRRHRIYGMLALAGLFACGLMVGIAINGGGHRAARADVKEIGMTEGQCNGLAKQISALAESKTMFGQKVESSDADVAKLHELNEIYSKHCAGRKFVAPEPEKTAPKPVTEDAAPKETCAVIEEMMLNWINPESSETVDAHNYNIATYEKLVTHGCPENKEKYQELIAREQKIIAALTGQESSENTSTCSEIERLLQVELSQIHNQDYVSRAKQYAKMSERGCPENAQKYADLAARELEIARALSDDKFDNDETVEVVETYKRIQMKQAAQDVINKVQKITDPAIDFIMELNKIINE
ncbi:hypothetical protein HDR66_03565 [bacterium]|nr:hypothetical protein [bacterium]